MHPDVSELHQRGTGFVFFVRGILGLQTQNSLLFDAIARYHESTTLYRQLLSPLRTDEITVAETGAP